MRLEELLKGEEPVFMGDGNLYQMVINQEITVHLRSFSGERFFYLYGKIGELQNDREKGEILERLMEAHLFGQESGDAYFSLHRQTHTLLLMAAFDSEVATYQQLQSRLQTFIEILEHWKKELKMTRLPARGDEDFLKAMSEKKKRIFRS